MWLFVALACAPEPGTYLVETTGWATTCRVGGGGYEEPAAQYQIEAYIESETELWLDDNPCTRTGLRYACADDPIVMEGDDDSTIAVTRVWEGAWTDPRHFTGDVSWATTCSGSGCATSTVELCTAEWTFAAVNVVAGE